MDQAEAQILGMDASVFMGKLWLLLVVVCVAGVVTHWLVRIASKALDRSEIPSVTIFINILRVIIWTFALLIVLEPVFGIQPTAFVTALGIGGIVLSFGLQDTIKNVVAGIILMATHAIKPDDNVKFGDVRGKVVDITWRNTILRTRAGDELVIPNSVLNNTSFVRLGERDATEIPLEILLAPGVDPTLVSDDIRATAEEALGKWCLDDLGVFVWPTEISQYGTHVNVLLHLAPGIMWDEAVSIVASALATKPYLAHDTEVEPIGDVLRRA